MAGQKWKRAAALLLAGGMLLSPCQYVFAAEGQAQESVSAAESGTLTALDGNGSPAAVSDTVLAMLDAGTVYLDEASGYLLSTADGARIDPVTGEAIAQMVEKEQSEEPAESDEPQSPEDPKDSGEDDTGNSGDNGDTEKTENPENPEGQEDADNAESPEDSKDTGENEHTENTEDTGDTENPEESGDNGDIEAPEVSEQGGDQSGHGYSENAICRSQNIFCITEVVF